MSEALYRGMDRRALDAAYDNRAAVRDYPAIAAARAAASDRYRATARFEADLRYGAGARERLDLFPAEESGAPLLVFIHGGYWQWNDKEPSSFLVPGPRAHGFAVALVEYTLAPEADIERIVGEVRRAIDWLAANAARLGADPAQIYVTGNSAGGHLAAETISHPAVRGVIPISGLFDLEPIRLNYLNDKLGLTEAAVARYSPIRNIPASAPPLVVAVGAAELPELIRQSKEYAAALAARGLPARYLPLAGHDHFSILDELARPEGALCRALLELSGAKAG
jgi:acetyl esterase/lipase